MIITRLKDFLLLENVRQAKNILKKLKLDPKKEDDYNGIVDQLNRLPNLIGKFVKFRYEDDIDIDDIKPVINWVLTNRQLVGRLPKNILDYNNFENLEDDINELNREHKIKKFYNSLYRSMKDQVDRLDEQQKDIFDNLSIKFMNMSEEERKQFTPLKYFEANNVTIEQFVESLNNFVNKNAINSDKDSVMEKIKSFGDKVKVVYDKDNVLVVRTNDKKAVCDLGSSNWCIVYSDSYAENYFGVKTDNTQYIIFNFNLPSSSSNSMFGVTINKKGESMYGASQNKSNSYVPVDKIREMTGIPKNILIPNPEVLERKRKYNKMISDIRAAMNKDSLVAIIDVMRKNDMSKNIDERELRKITEIETPTTFKRSYINNYFLSDVATYVKNNKFKELFLDYPEIMNYVDLSVRIDSIVDISGVTNDDILFLIVAYTIKNGINPQSDIMFKSLNRTKKTFDYFLSIVDTDYIHNMIKEVEEKYNNNVEIINMDKFFNKKIKEYIELFEGKVLSNANNSFFTEIYQDGKGTEFEQYLKFYDKYVDDEPKYDQLFTTYMDSIFKTFVDHEDFMEFIKYNLTNEDYSMDLTDILSDIHYGDYYSLLDKTLSSNNIVKLYDLKNEEFDEYIFGVDNDIIRVFLYSKGSNRVTIDDITESLDIIVDNSGNTVVDVGDFTTFDDFFEDEPFNDIDKDVEPYHSDLSNNDLEYYLDMINDKNIIRISMILKDNEIIDIKGEDLYSIKKQVIDCLENYNVYDVDDIYKAINYAYDDVMSSKQYDGVFNYLIDDVVDVLGSETISKGNPYYWVKRRSGAWSLVFSIGVDYITKNIDYNGLYYYAGDDFTWKDLAMNYIEVTGKLSINYDRLNSSMYVSNKNSNDMSIFNERLADSLYDI